MELVNRKLCMLSALALCFAFIMQGLPVFAERQAIKIVFSGTVSPINPMVTPYSQLVGKYIAERENIDVNILEKPIVDIDSEAFAQEVEKDIASEDADVVFLELDISRKYKNSDASEKVETVVAKLLSRKKTPTIYFVYTPEKTFFDYREPFDKVAAYYNIPICDTFTMLKRQYLSGVLKISDFLTAGIKPSEDGQEIFANIIINDLRGRAELFVPPKTVEKTMTDITRYDVKTDNEIGRGNEETRMEDGTELIYVSRRGSDLAKGTEGDPIATLDEARKRVRALKKQQGKAFKGATVYIREGLYLLPKGLDLEAEDSGTENGRVIYSGYPGEKVRLTNASLLDSEAFRPVTNIRTLERIPQAARGKVHEYNLAANGINSGRYRAGGAGYHSSSRGNSLGNLLVVDGKQEQRAIYPNGGWSTVSAKHKGTNSQITYSENKGEQWKTADDAWIKGVLGQGYYLDFNKITGFDFENRIINMTNATPFTVKPGWLWAIVNLLEELDSPSEWYVDRANEMLYYYPRGDIREDEILFSSNTNPIVRFNNTKYITLQNVMIEGGCGDGVAIINGIKNTVAECEIKNIGRAGVYIYSEGQKGTTENGVKSSYIHDTAMMGVWLVGGDRAGLTAQENYVVNCHIENYSAEMKSETGGVVTEGTVGAVIRSCTIHNDDSAAIFMGGNDDLIEYNELYNVVKSTDDYGVIYGDSRGAIRQGVNANHNYFHDVIYSFPEGLYNGFIAGFYSDAQRNNGAKVDNNVFVDVRNPVYLSNNMNMTVRQNLMLDGSGYAIRADVAPSERKTSSDLMDEALQDGSFFNIVSEAQARTMLGSNGVLIYRGYLSSADFTKENENAYYLKYPWLENYLYKRPLEGGYLHVKNNASFGLGSGIGMDDYRGDTSDTTRNFVTKESIDYTEGSTSEVERVRQGMLIAKEQVADFEIWDVTSAGSDGVKDTVSDFELIYPPPNAENVDVTFLTLRWDLAGGADEYQVVIATDAAFENIVYSEIVRDNYASPAGLQYGTKKYFWKVTASSLSEKIRGTPQNQGGVYSFTTKKMETTNKDALFEMLTAVEKMREEMVEGTLGGEYPDGSKKTLDEMLLSAKSVYDNKYTTQARIDEIYAALLDVQKTMLATRNILEIDFTERFNKLSDASVKIVGENVIKSAENVPEVIETGGGLSIKGVRGGLYANKAVQVHEVVRFTASFDFSGDESIYAMFGIRTEAMSEHMYNVPSYVFLVTKNNIELQGFKGGANIGKFYFTVPNTFIREGEEHDIEFCAVPAREGKAVRIILTVDGQLVYDHYDENNIIETGGYAGIVFSNAQAGVTITPAKTNAGYPSLAEKLYNDDSELNKNNN